MRRLLWLLLLAAVACARSAAKTFPGPATARSGTAIVTVRTWAHSLGGVVPAHGWITGVDGKRYAEAAVEVLPGLHTLVIDWDRRNTAPCTAMLVAEKGHTYRAVFTTENGTRRTVVRDTTAHGPDVACTPSHPPPLLR